MENQIKNAKTWNIAAFLIFCIPFSGLISAKENVCKEAGLTGKGLGLCTAYCEAMNCDSDNSNASLNACEQVQANFLTATGLGELPCDDGSGEPPNSELNCPCDFSTESWLDSGLLESIGLQSPNQICQLQDDSSFLVLTDDLGEDGISIQSQIVDTPDDFDTARFTCAAIAIESFSTIFSPEPFGAAEMYSFYDSGRLPEQESFQQACRLDLAELINIAFPDLICDE